MIKLPTKNQLLVKWKDKAIQNKAQNYTKKTLNSNFDEMNNAHFTEEKPRALNNIAILLNSDSVDSELENESIF